MFVIVQPQGMFISISSFRVILKRGFIKVEAMVGVQHDWIQHWRYRSCNDLNFVWRLGRQESETNITAVFWTCEKSHWQWLRGESYSLIIIFVQNKLLKIKKFRLWIAQVPLLSSQNDHSPLLLLLLWLSSFLKAGANDKAPDWTRALPMNNIHRPRQKKGDAA